MTAPNIVLSCAPAAKIILLPSLVLWVLANRRNGMLHWQSKTLLALITIEIYAYGFSEFIQGGSRGLLAWVFVSTWCLFALPTLGEKYQLPAAP